MEGLEGGMGALNDFDQSSYWFESVEYDLQTARAMLQTQRFHVPSNSGKGTERYFCGA